uniref:Type I inositol 3,4-bisphosphate 4-phosphatase-like n=1 Tax=Saccoglossus kowalevskii TaxID=10224 RepID=A0ABM0MGX8_SACKO|nr:PREDICTED: type I inositol 3,4-bisphosphate 4-phosphatase-like [Saccoglossus kowalevskii]
MRYNSKELSQLAIQPPKYFTKEGSLFMKESNSGLKNELFGRKKNESYSERWCRLRSNMLFYFKGKDMLSEPNGVIILEQCSTMEADTEQNRFCFVIAFPHDDKVQYLAAHTAEQRDEWVVALQQASYEGLRCQLNYLRTKLLARTGKDPLSTDQSDTVGGDPAAGSEVQYNPEEPVLELSIACQGLPLSVDGKPPTTFVAISTLSPPHQTSWIRCAQTETIQNSCDPCYLTSVAFDNPRDITMITRVKATVYDVRDRAQGMMNTIGQSVSTIKDITTSADNKLTLPILSLQGLTETEVGKLTILLWETTTFDKVKGMKRGSNASQEFQPQATVFKQRGNSISRDPLLKYLFVNALSKSYRRPEMEGRPLIVQEIMAETLLSFHLPQEILKLFIEDDKVKNRQLCQLGGLVEPFSSWRKDIMDLRLSTIDSYLEAINVIKNHKGKQFKTSVEKANAELEFVAINLHLQRMKVSIPDGKGDEVYDVITIGAPAAHSLKFKSGGLKKLLQQHNYRESIGSAPVISLLIPEIQALEKNLKCLKTKIDWYANEINLCVSTGSRQSLPDVCTKYTDKVCELLMMCENPLIQEAVDTLKEAREELESIPKKNEKSWQDTSKQIKDDITKLNQMIEAESVSVDDRTWQEDANKTVQSLTSNINHLYQHLTDCLALILIKEGHQYRIKVSELQHRRDIVFTQAITGAIAGVYTKLSTHGKDQKFLSQISQIGILLQFESLLSTYSTEMGMLEDMVVGIEDLNNVTIQFILETDSKMPSVKGDRSHVIVEIPIPRSSFSRLPNEVQRGQQIKLCPVLFTMGINELATLAERIGDTSFQDQINRENLFHLKNYFENFMKLTKRKSGFVEVSRTDSLDVLIARLQDAVGAKKSKNVDILQLSAEICSHMTGIRFTSCKSAKDRTAMSVTLEQCMILQRNYGLDARTFAHLLDTMRSEGTRRTNTMKNVGIRKYAFNGFQVATLPKLYRPPDGTYGNTAT